MNRRQFAVASLVSVGCVRKGTDAQPSVSQPSQRERHLQELLKCRVAASAERTTPKPVVDVVAEFPQLKPLLKVAVRLHPRFGEEPPPSASKLGGQFLWPATESYPPCPEFGMPMQPVLQLRIEDAPPQFPVRPKTDLFQLLWTPRATAEGPPHVVGVWRKRTELPDALAASPELGSGQIGYVPVPCRLFPERVAELPPPELMPAEMRTVIRGWKSPVPFDTHLTAARGTKAGGWPRVPEVVRCRTCVRPMDYLLTIDSAEWSATDAARWKPIQDADDPGFRSAAGFEFQPQAIQISVCKRCEKWPLRAVVVTPS